MTRKTMIRFGQIATVALFAAMPTLAQGEDFDLDALIAAS